MLNRIVGPVVAALALLVVDACAQPQRAGPIVVPDWLGNPSSERWPNDYYPRNVWDLQSFGGALYIGAGNSSNFGPSQNAGPVPITRYDGRYFDTVHNAREEQIDLFRVFGRTLYIPGQDAKQGWEFGNFYKYDGRSWQVFRNIPNGIHVYDFYRRGDRFIAVGGSRNQPSSAWVASSEAGPWRSAIIVQNPEIAPVAGSNVARVDGGRMHCLFTIGEELFASGVAYIQYSNATGQSLVLVTLFAFDDDNNLIPIGAVDGDGRPIGANLFPNAQFPRRAELMLPQVRRAVIGQDGVTYYLGALAHNDSQWMPFGVFAASDVHRARRLPTPEGALVYDLLVHQGALYALSNQVTSPPETEVQVLRLREDGRAFDVAFRFLSPTFARSFEVYRGDWYFGLGSEISVEDSRLTREAAARIDWTERLSSETGSIVRVRGRSVGH